MLKCPLCQSQHTSLFSADSNREYWQCQQCSLVFVPLKHHLSPEEEKKHYLLHNNDLNDLGYRQFLQRLATPLLEELGKITQYGLDFGCGPGPLLAQMCQDAGHHMTVWDPFFAPNDFALAQEYDFICCTEAIEHFVDPAKEWQLMLNMLKPGGLMAIMTSFYPKTPLFESWYYKRDPTHISFFSIETFQFLASRDKLIASFPLKDVVLLRKAG